VISIEQLNAMDRPEFVATLGAIFEHSPWVAERAAAQRPFRSRLDLLDAMADAVSAAAPAEQIALIRAHPRLGARVLGPNQLTPASAREQSRAGLTACTAAEYQRLEQLNVAYAARFDFPFILAVRGHNPASVVAAFERRLGHERREEQRTALRQIGTIAGFRLADLLEPAPGQEIAAMVARAPPRSGEITSEESARSELAATFSEWMLAAGLTVWQEAGGYLLGQNSNGRPDAGTMVLGLYVDPANDALWAGDTLDILVAIGVAQQLRPDRRPHPFNLTIVANPQTGPVRDTAGLLDAGQMLRWARLSAGNRNQGPGVALHSALGEPSALAGARLLVRTRTAPGELRLPVNASQAARAVQWIEKSFAAERT
jgi:beta-ureidopropionase / N-carbamoyl-L-amino-acid hydrolase